MTRYVLDAASLLRLIADDRLVAAAHSLVAPARIRSDALATLYRAARDGSLDEKIARRYLERVAEIKVRLLADRVSRHTAWRIASHLGWDDTALAEYLAVAKLQADALVTTDPILIDGAKDLLPVAAYNELFEESGIV